MNKAKGSKPADHKAANFIPTTISGDPRLMLIAPHGFHQETPELKSEPKMDDDYTGHITEEVARLLKCSAIINYKVHRDDIDFNDTAVEKNCPAFIEAIKNVLNKKGKTLVVWLHGISDGNLRKDTTGKSAPANNKKNASSEIHALIGFGQGSPPRNTADDETIAAVITLLQKNKMNAAFANEEKNRYCGWAKGKMNQWFLNQGYDFTQVQSIQIEIKKTGFREKTTITKTAKILARTFSEYLKPSASVKQYVNVEKKLIKGLVDRAFENITQLASNNKDGAMLDAGNYIIEEFFDNNFIYARINAPTKKHSLKGLKQKIKNTKNKPPALTWFYDAIKLVIDENHYRDNSAYGKLDHSHKVCLAHVKDPEKKKLLIDETIKYKYTVAQLRQRISGADTDIPSLPLDKLPATKDLQQLDLKTLEALKLKADDLSKFHRKKSKLYSKARIKIASVLKDQKAFYRRRPS